MKVTVDRIELRESTVVVFEFTDQELLEAEYKSRTAGALRPPRIDTTGPLSAPVLIDWIQYIAWLARAAN